MTTFVTVVVIIEAYRANTRAHNSNFYTPKSDWYKLSPQKGQYIVKQTGDENKAIYHLGFFPRDKIKFPLLT